MNSTEKRIHRALRQLSFLSDVHVVGGAVRDMLLERDSDDIDLATSDRPETVKEKAQKRNWNVVETGIDHGTVTLLAEGLEYEVTTFRRDVSTDGRNATVEFADDVEDDLSRRDFTMNALAMRVQTDERFSEGGGVIVDPFDGMKHMQQGVIRTVGDPRRRFREDFLRIVRALRFAARYGFRIGEEEQRAMADLSGRVHENVSVERIMTEIEKAMKDDRPADFLNGLTDLGILKNTLGVVLRNEEDLFRCQLAHRPEDRMLVFLWQLKHCALLEWDELQERLKLSNDRVRRARRVGSLLHLLDGPRSEPVRRKVLAAYSDVLETAERIGTQAKGIPADRFAEPEDVPLEPIVTGQDFLDEGFEEGPQIGDLVQKAHDVQLEEAITDADTLIERAQSQ